MALQSVLQSSGQRYFSPAEISASLPDAIKWYTELGLFSEKTTLFLSKTIYDATTATVTTNSQSPAAANQLEALYHAIDNIHSYVRIFKTFSLLEQDHLPKKRLREALFTPFLPREEVPGTANVNPRNALFEMEFAADMIESGFKVTGFDDLVFEIGTTRVVAECKRLHSEKSISENCTKAKQQIYERFESIRDRGLVVISYDKPYKADENFLMAKSEDAARQACKQLFNDFYERNRSNFSILKKSRIFGLFFIFKAHTLLESDHLISPSYYRSFVQLTPDTPNYDYESQLCESFFRALKPI